MNFSNARIFISYSHRGSGPEWKARLLRALHVFEHHHLLDVWQDGKIRISSYWDDDIKQAMGNAELAIVLLTKEAVESEYILNTEFPFLRNRQQSDKMPVFPVVCEPCDWKAHDWLRATQAPNESSPLSQLSEIAQDRIFRKLATDIAAELSRVALAELPKPDQPLPPDHIYLEKFPLTHGPSLGEERLIGREQELALLDLAYAQPHNAIVSLVAWGGVGKTMLVQHWLQRLQREGWFGAQRIYAWSFYSQGTKEDRQASEDMFLSHALQWNGVQCDPAISPWDKGRLLADAFARERTLLILDGIEPLQYPPGPMGGQLRAPGVQSLLKQLARKANNAEQSGLCLVTTREPLTDLVDYERRPDAAWGGVLRVDLGNLTEDAGAALLHHAGAKNAGAAEIKPDDNELLAASREVDGHALTLNLLGRFLARAHVGDIRRRDLVKFAEADLKEQGGTAFKMLSAFENWFNRGSEVYKQQLAVLRILGLFDRPADAGCIAALRKPPVIAGLTDSLFATRSDEVSRQTVMEPLLEEDWNAATSSLADFGLVVIHAKAEERDHLIECHPLIREYFAKLLGGMTASTAHRRLYDYLLLANPEQTHPSLEDLQPLYQAIYHGCRAGCHEVALKDIYDKRICQGDSHYSWRVLNAYGTDVVALANFFSGSWSRPEKSLTLKDQAHICNDVSFCLRAVGRTIEAVKPANISVLLFNGLGRTDDAANTAGSAAEVLLALGDIAAAEKLAAMATNFASSGDPRWIVITQAIYAATRHFGGHLEEAATIFEKVESYQSLLNPGVQSYLVPPQGYHYCELLLDLIERPIWRQTISLPTASKEIQSPSFRDRCQEVQIRAGTYLAMMYLHPFAKGGSGLHRECGLAHIIGARGALCQSFHECDDKEARSYVDAALKDMRDGLTELRLGSETEDVALGLYWSARLRVLEGDPKGARADLDEAWDIAERGPMRLHLADIHLHRARLFFREKQYPWKSPQDDLAAAEKLINECGYHRRDQELADAKSAILGSNGVNV